MKIIIRSNEPKNEFLPKCIDIHFYKMDSNAYGIVLIFPDNLSAEKSCEYIKTWMGVNFLIVKLDDGKLEYGLYPNPVNKEIDLYRFPFNHYENYVADFLNTTSEESIIPLFIAVYKETNNYKILTDKDCPPLYVSKYKYIYHQDAKEWVDHLL